MFRFDKHGNSPLWRGSFRFLVVGIALQTASIAFAAEIKDKPLAESMLGVWTVELISFSDAGGKVDYVSMNNNAPGNASITPKKIIVRMGNKPVTEMSYTLGTDNGRSTIDAVTPEGPLAGICYVKGDKLKASFNDKKKGPPPDFNKQHGGMAYVLRRFPAYFLYVMNSDGSNMRQLKTPPAFTAIGSPDWSRDGSRIAFDVWRSVMGERLSDARILVLGVDNDKVKDLGPGAMPSWSPDDKQITFCRYGSQHGVWIMNADGSKAQLVDAGGWGSQWSPKNNEIAYVSHDNGKANLCIYDVETKNKRNLLDRDYRQIFWGNVWSPDGKWICFKGILADGSSEIAAVSTEGEKEGFKVILPSSAETEIRNANSTMDWGGNGEQIIISTKTKKDSKTQFYVYDFSGKQSPELLPGFPKKWASGNAIWSPDGKRIVFCAIPPVE